MTARITVLDAEPTVRAFIAETLRRAGYVVEAAETLEAALKIIEANPPDLMLTNVYLPGIPGVEAMRLLKNTYPELPILMVSRLPNADVIREGAGRTASTRFRSRLLHESCLRKCKPCWSARVLPSERTIAGQERSRKQVRRVCCRRSPRGKALHEAIKESVEFGH